MASVSPFTDPGPIEAGPHEAGEESLLILQSLICVLREKNVLSRGDMEELVRKVERLASGESRNPLPCCATSAGRASVLMRRLAGYMGQRYGGRHGRWGGN